MPKISILRCSLCGEEHNESLVTGLKAKGWFAAGVSKQGICAKRLICPYCLERIMGRKLSPHQCRVLESY